MHEVKPSIVVAVSRVLVGILCLFTMTMTFAQSRSGKVRSDRDPFRYVRSPVLSGEIVPNVLWVSNPVTNAQSLHEMPIQLSRFFAPGEIGTTPVAYVDGVLTPTQVDVKTRWHDGSLQHAIISLPVSLPSGATCEVYLAEKPDEQPLSGAGLTLEQMLSDDYELGAVFEITTPEGTRSISVREMLAQGHFRYWLRGPLTTQVIVEEASPELNYDLDWNGNKSFHPIFVLTFHPGYPGVKVEFIAENSWMDRLQDITYSVQLKTGRDAKITAYEKKNYLHAARTRWRKVFWSGPSLPSISVDHNLPYLVYSRAVPNFDLSIRVPPAAVAEDLNAFQKGDRGDLGGSCLFAKYLPTTGARPELGPFTRWDTRYLYTFDPRLEQIVRSCADTSAYLPVHFRESRSQRTFTAVMGEWPDVAENGAFGKVASVDARPGFCSRDGGLPFSTNPDKPLFVDKATYGGWTPDMAHQPSFTYIAYLLTGEWFYLEEMYFWSSWNLAQGTPGNCYFCRGSRQTPPFESFAVLHGNENERFIGWTYRTLMHTALMAPDGTPEKAYFNDKLLNNIAVHEGRFNITESSLHDDPLRSAVWRYGRDVLSNSRGNPLYFWADRTGANVPSNDQIVDPQKTYSIAQSWQTFVATLPFGWMSEVGYPSDAVRQKLGRFLVSQLVDPEYNPYLVDSYTTPSAPSQTSAFLSWAEVLAAFRASRQTSSQFQQTAVSSDFSYGFIALCTASFLTDIQVETKTGMDGYLWLKQNYPQQELLRANPKWAIVPRLPGIQGSIQNRASWATSPRARKQVVRK